MGIDRLRIAEFRKGLDLEIHNRGQGGVFCKGRKVFSCVLTRIPCERVFVVRARDLGSILSFQVSLKSGGSGSWFTDYSYPQCKYDFEPLCYSCL